MLRRMAGSSQARSLAEVTYRQIDSWIRTAAFAEDTRLPGEHALARQFSVSRPVLRQALARLRAEGRLYARRGAGTFVQLGANAGLALTFASLTNIPDVRRFLEFRCSVEGEMAADAARRRTKADLEAIDMAMRALEREMTEGRPGIEADIALHAACARASGNRFYVALLETLSEQTRFSIRLTRELATQPAGDRVLEARLEHTRVCDAIRDGNPDAARAAMRAHLTGGIARLFGQGSDA